MSAFKSHKRSLSVKSDSGSPNPKTPKIDTTSPIVTKTPKQKNKTPKKDNQQILTPAVNSLKKNNPNQLATPKQKLEKFKGTAKLDLKTPSATPGTDKKNVKPSPTTSEPSEEKRNRHTRRRTEGKEKRRAQRAKFGELKIKALQGDEEALKEIQRKLSDLESSGSVSRTKNRKLAVLKRILNKDDTTKKVVKVQANKKKVVQAPVKVETKVQKKLQNGKIVQTKKPIVQADEDDVDEDESDEDDDEVQESAEDDDSDQLKDEDDDDEDGSAEEDDEESEGSEEVVDDDDEEEEDDDDEEGESDEDTVVSTKKPVQEQKKSVQKTKPGKQDFTSKPSGASPNKSRYVVFVGNIAYTSTDNDLREHFKKVGEIADVRIPTSQEGKPRGFAYVELKNEISYQKALSLHNTFLGGRKINVLYSEGGKKKSDNQKGAMKAKNFKLQAMRKQGQLHGSVKESQKRSARRGKNKQKGT